MYYFVKMTKWHGREISDVASYEQNIQEFVNGGEMVILCDDVEEFTELVGIEEEDIEWL